MTQRRVLSLATPIIGENLLQTLVGAVDTFMVARLGAAAVAGVGTGFEIVFFIISILSAINVRATVLVSQAIGARDNRRANQLARQAIVWGLLLAIPVSVVIYLAAPFIIGLFGTEPDVAEAATTYLEITAATIVALFLSFVCGAVLRGAGDSRTPARGRGPGQHHQYRGRLHADIREFRLSRARRRRRAGWRGSRARARRDLHAVGDGSRQESDLAAWFLGLAPAHHDRSPALHTWYTGRSRADALLRCIHGSACRRGPHWYTGACRPADCLHRAIDRISARNRVLGHRHRTRRSEHRRASPVRCAKGMEHLLRWAIAWLGIGGVLVYVFSEQLMRIFSTDPEVIWAGVSALHALSFALPFWAIWFVSSGSLRGSGDARR